MRTVQKMPEKYSIWKYCIKNHRECGKQNQKVASGNLNRYHVYAQIFKLNAFKLIAIINIIVI